MNVIEEVKKSVELDIRPVSRDNEYLEAVLNRKDLPTVNAILKKHLGAETKKPGQRSAYSLEVQKTVDSIGGLRVEQSFYFKEDNGKVIFAALWPWETNPNKITLKMGIRPLLFP